MVQRCRFYELEPPSAVYRKRVCFFLVLFVFLLDFCEKPFIYINVSHAAYSAYISRVTPLMKTVSNVSAEAFVAMSLPCHVLIEMDRTKG